MEERQIFATHRTASHLKREHVSRIGFGLQVSRDAAQKVRIIAVSCLSLTAERSSPNQEEIILRKMLSISAGQAKRRQQ